MRRGNSACRALRPVRNVALFKKYLSLINPEKNIVEGKGWSEISEGKANVEDWPGTVLRPSGSGGGKEVAKVAETPSSIGYANLADAYNNGGFIPPAGGAKTSKFWTPIQNNGLGTTGATYQDPAVKKEKAALVTPTARKPNTPTVKALHSRRKARSTLRGTK